MAVLSVNDTLKRLHISFEHVSTRIVSFGNLAVSYYYWTLNLDRMGATFFSWMLSAFALMVQPKPARLNLQSLELFSALVAIADT